MQDSLLHMTYRSSPADPAPVALPLADSAPGPPIAHLRAWRVELAATSATWWGKSAASWLSSRLLPDPGGPLTTNTCAWGTDTFDLGFWSNNQRVPYRTSCLEHIQIYTSTGRAVNLPCDPISTFFSF